MPNVIYTVRPDGLLREADSIERSAKESQKSWIILGQYDKYGDTMQKADLLRRAAAEKSVYTRREILRNAGYTVKTPKALSKNPKTRNIEGVTMATKKFSPAQIAAQKLFAERARAGTLGKGTKRKPNPATEREITSSKERPNYRIEQLESNSPDYFFMSEAGAIAEAKKLVRLDGVGNIYKNATKRGAFKWEMIYWFDSTGVYPVGSYGQAATRINPAKRKPNPDKTKPRAYVMRASQTTGRPPVKGTKAGNRLITRRKKALSAPAGYFPNPKVKYTNRAKDLKGEQRVGYSVHRADAPSYLAIAWFSKKSDAVQVAQEASDRTGKQLAVTRVQNYFGPM